MNPKQPEIRYGSCPFHSGVPQQYGGIAQKRVGGEAMISKLWRCGLVELRA